MSRRPERTWRSGYDHEELDDASLTVRRSKAERDALIQALARAKNNRTLAARQLNVSRRTLYNKLKEHGME